MILTSDPGAAYRAHQGEIDQAIKTVLESGWYVLGENVTAFEQEFANWCGVDFGVGVASGTDAISLALRALDIVPGDEVITVSHTAVPTVAAVEAIGAVPVLADVDADTYTLDPDQLSGLLSARTKAILSVHLYGHPCDMQTISAFANGHGLAVVEDCAQAHGATIDGQKVGGFSDVACFSLFPTKNLGGIGDGGIVVTNDSLIADKLRRLRQYGWDRPQHSIQTGLCSRLDELQAAILRVKLRYLDDDIKRRQEIADIYNQAFSQYQLELPVVRSGCTHSYHLYVVQSSRREALRGFLEQREIISGIHYPQPVHTQPAYAGRLATGTMAITDKISPLILSLPLYPQMSAGDIESVVSAVSEFFG